jgi:predicted TIM-barrel fold metal-dependent hydrolase
VLKLHCSVGKFEIDDPRLGDALDLAGELGVPIVYHAGHAINGSTEAHDLAPLDRAARAHSATTFILAHFGHHALRAGVALVDAHPNVCADLTPVIGEAVQVSAEDLNRLAPKLLFGSDAPNTGFTAGALLAGLRARADAETLDAILGANALRATRRSP